MPLLAALTLSASIPAPSVAQQGGVDLGAARMEAASPFPVAELQGLDKVTARVSTFTATVDRPVTFGGLTVEVLACWRNPPEETPESAAYVEILDSTEASGRPIFTGWIYASSPAVNALEHPVYDVWLLDCLPASAEDEGGAGDDEAGGDEAGDDEAGDAQGAGDGGRDAEVVSGTQG